MSKRQKIPEDSVWQLRGRKSGVVLHDDVTLLHDGLAEAPHLLRGETGVPLALVPVGGRTTIVLEGLRPLEFDLVRKL